MKKLFLALIFLFIVSLSFSAMADVRVVTEPFTAGIADAADIEIDGVIVADNIGISYVSDTTERVEYDVTGIAVGPHTVRIRLQNMWDGEGTWSDPFGFTRPEGLDTITIVIELETF